MNRLVEAGITSLCRARITSRAALPGACARCGERVYLVLPYGWRALDGREHECD